MCQLLPCWQAPHGNLHHLAHTPSCRRRSWPEIHGALKCKLGQAGPLLLLLHLLHLLLQLQWPAGKCYSLFTLCHQKLPAILTPLPDLSCHVLSCYYTCRLHNCPLAYLMCQHVDCRCTAVQLPSPVSNLPRTRNHAAYHHPVSLIVHGYRTHYHNILLLSPHTYV